MDWQRNRWTAQARALMSLKGRTSRLGYWRIGLLANVLGLSAFALVVFATLVGGRLAAPLILLILPVIWIGIATTVRRLHDRGKSGWWALVFYAPTFVVGAIEDLDGGGIGIVLLAWAALFISVWGFIEIGCLKGQATPNWHGPPPAAGA